MIVTVPQLGEGLTEVTILKHYVATGAYVEKDQPLLLIETDKASMDIEAPVSGTIEQWFFQPNEIAPVGEPLFSISESAGETVDETKKETEEKTTGKTIKQSTETTNEAEKKPAKKAFVPPKSRAYAKKKQVNLDDILAQFTGRMLLPENIDDYIAAQETSSSETSSLTAAVDKPATIASTSSTTLTKKSGVLHLSRSSKDIFIQSIAAVTGAKTVSNADLGLDENVLKTTGIASRQYVEKQTVLSLACDAVNQVLQQTNSSLGQIDYIICSTGTPNGITPSLANQLLNQFLEKTSDPLQAKTTQRKHIAAVDINAACSGWLYALQMAYDYLSNSPQSNVLVVTSEVLSPLLDKNDPQTLPLFGDAATATLLSNNHQYDPLYSVLRPMLSSACDHTQAITVPFQTNDSAQESPERQGYLSVDGKTVFDTAVRGMKELLTDYCQTH